MFASAAAFLITPASAADYTWGGGTGLWNSSNWLPGNVSGPTSAAHTAIINSGTVRLTGHDMFGNGGGSTATTAIQVNNGATLDTNNTTNPIVGLTLNGGNLLINGGHSSTWGGVRLSGTLTVGGSAASTISSTGVLTSAWIGVGNNTVKDLTISVADATGNSNTDLTISSAMIEGNWGANPHGVIKTGEGTLALNATNTYNGATLVSAGTLLVNGSLGSNSNVTIESNGTVGGSGTINGSLAFDAGANLDLTGGTVGLTSTNILTVAAGKSITLTSFTFADIVGWNWAAAGAGTYTLINGGGTVTLAGSTPTSANPYNFGNGKQGYFQAGSLQAVITAIPEPSAMMLGGLGLLALLRRRRA